MFKILKEMWAEKRTVKSLEERIPGLLPSELFHAECRKEKMRADRTLVPFTLLVFDVVNTTGDHRSRELALEVLGSIVVRCSRGSDTRGWHRSGERLQLGLLLHNTDAGKAERVIRTVREQFRQLASGYHIHNGKPAEIVCEAATYPNVAIDGEPPAPEPDRQKARSNMARIEGRLLRSSLPWWKRSTDIVMSLTALLFLSPIMLAVAALIKLVSPGPVFFRQQRVGYLGRAFTLYKFRTMHVNFDASIHEQHLARLIATRKEGAPDGDQPMQKLDDNNPQIIPFGRFLRKACLDELPQLFNVLRGEMSLVGPRPPIPYEVKEYLRWHSMRFDAVPGMTGLWQVSGKNRTTFKEMIRLDIRYACQRSFLLDMKIILKTVPVVMSQLYSKATVARPRPTVVEAQENA
ncbi:sugar transferase [bacterium]|nr:sugar transferase [bacterium]